MASRSTIQTRRHTPKMIFLITSITQSFLANLIRSLHFGTTNTFSPLLPILHLSQPLLGERATTFNFPCMPLSNTTAVYLNGLPRYV